MAEREPSEAKPNEYLGRFLVWIGLTKEDTDVRRRTPGVPLVFVRYSVE
jgi:hypothetical protein